MTAVLNSIGLPYRLRPNTATVSGKSFSCVSDTVSLAICFLSDITTCSVSTSVVFERDTDFLGFDIDEVEATELPDVDIEV